MSKKELEFDLFAPDLFEAKMQGICDQLPGVEQQKGDKTEQNDIPKPSLEFNSEFNSHPKYSSKELRQAVLQWLVPQNPTGIGVKVPVHSRKYQVAVAAFWSKEEKKRKQLGKTVLIEICTHRDHCWPDCSKASVLLKNLRALKQKRDDLEKIIRETEPELKENDILFDEFQRWDYSSSSNIDYHKCLRQIEKAQHSLYKGSRLESMRKAHVADFIYVAVPANSVHPHELADDWGLLYIHDDKTVSVAKPALSQFCSIGNKVHLLQNIVHSNLNNVLFCHGVNVKKTGEVKLTKPPRRRRI